jgi:peptidoglycan biosynthesis protein MviN/MurJ (putative lipid II flippase)
MQQPRRSLLAGIQEAFRALGNDARQMLALRWKLAKLEAQADAQALKRLVALAIAAVVMVLTALPLLLVFAADLLDGQAGIARAGWLLIFAVALLAAGVATSMLAWRHFRRRFTGMQQTREEVREDLIWLGELTGRGN